MIGVLVAALAAVAIHVFFRRDLDAAHARIAAGSAIAQTACGPIEYAERGRGSAVLLVHGAGGGWDQGIEIAEALAAAGHRVVAVSRFGYLRTPLPGDASPQAQADAHACLLDALGIERAAVIGISAGGPSSMQFAIRHPARTSGLVLLVALAWRPGPTPAPPPALARMVYEGVLRSDFAYWALLRSVPNLLVETVLATPREALETASASERAVRGVPEWRARVGRASRGVDAGAAGVPGATLSPALSLREREQLAPCFHASSHITR